MAEELLAVLAKEASDPETAAFLVEALANADEGQWSDIFEGFPVAAEAVLEVLRRHAGAAGHALLHLSAAAVQLNVVGLAGAICSLRVELRLFVQELKHLLCDTTGIR